MDLIREILLNIEGQPAGNPVHQIGLPDKWSPEEVVGHLRLVDQAGFLDGSIKFMRGLTFLMAVHGLSNKGHDFLDSIRDERVWAATKEKVEEVGGSVALDVVKAVAVAISTKLLGLGG